MASLKALKMRIASVKSTQKITKAMKMVAAAKLRRAQQAAEAARPYAERMAAVDRQPRLARSRSARRARSCSPAPASDQAHLLIVCTSDRGLAGGFNSNIVRAARRKAEALIAEGKHGLFLPGRPQGPRGDPPALPEADHPPARHQRDQAGRASPTRRRSPHDVIDRYQTDGIDVVHLFYARFQSALVQEPVGQQIIPVPPVEAERRAGVAAPRSNMSRTRTRSSPRCCRATSPSRSSAPCSRMPRPSRAAG